MNYGDPRLPDRFWDKVIPVPESGCLLWLGACVHGPQIRWKVHGAHKTVSCKRLVYEAVHGPQDVAAVGGCSDACVQPDHLIAGSHAEVTAAHFKRFLLPALERPFCRHGHERAVVGVYFSYTRDGDEVVHCRACHAHSIAVGRERKLRRRFARMSPERRQLYEERSERTRAGRERVLGPSLFSIYYPEGLTA